MKQALKTFFENHIDNSPPTENEYIKDGLKYCKVCNEPKQCKITFQGQEMIVGCACKCDNKIQDKINEAKKLQHINQLKEGIVDYEFRNLTFDKSDSELKFAKNYVKNFSKYEKENIGLMILGNTGTGKTYVTACIANALCEQRKSVYMATTIYLIKKLNDFNTYDETYNKIQKCSLMIIDDIGTERQTEYGIEQLENLIDIRYRAKKPLIITSNLTLSQIKNETNIELKRIYDRLKEMCHPIILNGENRRIKAANERYAKIKKELEL